MRTQAIRWSNIRAGAKIAGVDPHELQRRLQGKPLDLPDRLLDREKWIGQVADFVLSKPMEFNAELLARQIYDRFVARMSATTDASPKGDGNG